LIDREMSVRLREPGVRLSKRSTAKAFMTALDKLETLHRAGCVGEIPKGTARNPNSRTADAEKQPGAASRQRDEG
jgi:hypothetical protein